MAHLDPTLLAFADGPADVAAARALAAHPTDALLALVEDLRAGGRRAHLEALGEAGLPKPVRKAARAAAYKLKSAGVVGEARRPAKVVDLTTVEIPLDKVALVGAPGLDGHSWLVLSDLGDVVGAEVDLRDERNPPEAGVATEGLSRGRLRKFKRDVDNPRVCLVDADLAVRRIDRLATELSLYHGGLPPAWDHVQRWRERAIALGADASRVDAAAHLEVPAEAPDTDALTAVMSSPIVGFLAPPERSLEAVDDAIGELMHDEEPIEEADFRAALDAILLTAADRWFEEEGRRERVVAWLEDDADVLYAVGEEAMARTCLALAAQGRVHEGAGSAWPLLRVAFKSAIDADAAWLHRMAHVAGIGHD